MRVWQTLKTLFAPTDIESYAAHWPQLMNAQQIDCAVETLLEKMSLTEKIAQMSGDGGNFALLKLGFFVFLLKRFPNMYAGKNDRLHIPPLSFTDGPRGVVIGNATCFPAAMTRGASFDIALEQRIGAAIGTEARASGANYFAGLCVNLLRHPAWGRAQETYGEDPHHLGAMGVALMRGVQSQRVMVCAKHFAVNSIENSRFYLDVAIDDKTLHEVYLPHFKTLVDNGVDSLMSAYNQINGEYCGHDKILLHDILREQWQFDGFVSSDWLWGIYETIKPARAGMDIEMPRGHFYGKRLAKAVQCGDVAEDTINTSVRRILRKKLHWLSQLNTAKPPRDIIACLQHRQLAQESAEQSVVLLQNNGVLPWSKQQLTGKTIAVIGELAALPCLGDHGSSRVSPPHAVTFLAGLQQYAKDNIHIAYCDGNDIANAERIASTATVVLLVAGYRAEDEGENLTSNRKPVANPKVPRGGDRASLHLNAQQQQLITRVCAANRDTVVALISGSAVMMNNWQEKPAAILHAGYLGMEGGNALARILFGEVNPSGKLPFTIPAHETQLPAFDCWVSTAQYDYFHGYTLCDKQQQTPAFAFGFGLSYTQFHCNTPRTDKSLYSAQDTITASITIRNIGARSGSEVMQCYIGEENPVEEPTALKKLMAFEKIFLHPNEEKNISLSIPVQKLARYDTEQQQWIMRAGQYKLWLGTSSRAIDLQPLTIQVAI